MATFFRNKVAKDVGTTPVVGVTVSDVAKVTVIGLSLANKTSDLIMASVIVTDDLGTDGYYVKDILIPSNTSLRVLNGGEKLVLASLNELAISCNVDAGLDAIISYVEIVA